MIQNYEFELFGKEHAEFEESVREQRYNEQKQNKDYDYDNEGNIEYCDCGMALNSHGHCPRCDY